MLPRSKDDFPKLLILDQNQWVFLSNAHYGNPQGEQFKEALAAVRKAAITGKIIVPISMINVLEMDANGSADRRMRLAQFMVDLSCNHSISSYMTIRPWEVRNALFDFFGLSEPYVIRCSLVSEGLNNAFGQELTVSGLSLEDESWILSQLNSVENTLEGSDPSGAPFPL